MKCQFLIRLRRFQPAHRRRLVESLYGMYSGKTNKKIHQIWLYGKTTWGIIFLLMNEPCASIFAASRLDFNVFIVLIPGLEYEGEGKVNIVFPVKSI